LLKCELKVQITSTNINFYGKSSSLSTVVQVICVSEPINSTESMMPVQNAGTTRLYDSD